MLTPTRREVATTPAAKVPVGATLWGGYYDGLTVRHVRRIGWSVGFLLDDGRELVLNDGREVAWLHPASRRSS